MPKLDLGSRLPHSIKPQWLAGRFCLGARPSKSRSVGCLCDAMKSWTIEMPGGPLELAPMLLARADEVIE
jgi:hypothetical protein